MKGKELHCRCDGVWLSCRAFSLLVLWMLDSVLVYISCVQSKDFGAAKLKENVLFGIFFAEAIDFFCNI